jgi:phosphoglycolate phosphatase-like HAD superfamily hydrolase
MIEIAGIQLVILDFDGVIVESNDIKDRAFKKVFSRFPEYENEFFAYHQKYVSVSRYAKFDHVLERIGKPDDLELKNELLSDFSTYTIEMMRSVSFVKGAKEFLEDLYGKLPLYLVSVTPIDDLGLILDQLKIQSFFKTVYGCPPWNKPGAIKDILQNENQSPGNAVLIGDSYGDQRAAQETGTRFIGRDSGLGFEEPYPSLIIPDLSGLSMCFLKSV